ncbi:MAG: VOC family protein [Ilumatobacteraceae bacterium]
MPSIERLSHAGLYVTDIAVSREFYVTVLGLQVTDEKPDGTMVFLSSDPDREHHELLLAAGRDTAPSSKTLQQLSFRVPTLEDLVEYLRRFEQHQVELDMIVSHGNAVGIYFFDPDHNRVEVFWDTGLKARQVFLHSIDLTQPSDAIIAEVRRQVAEFGATGIIEEAFLSRYRPANPPSA